MSSHLSTIDRRDLLQTIGASTVATGIVSGISAADSSTIVVEEGDSIEDAINEADNGATIKVKPGTYEVQGLNVGKTLTLVGDPGGDDIGPGDDAPVIKPKDDEFKEGIDFRDGSESSGTGSEIRGFVFREFEWRGISGGEAADDITIEDNRFEDLGRGVATFGDNREYVGWMIRRNEVENVGKGFSLSNIHETRIVNNRITAVDEDGISINPDGRDFDIGVSEIDIVDNQIEECGFGVYLLARNDENADETIEMADVTVENNVVSDAENIAYRLSVGTHFEDDAGAVATIRNVVYEGNTARDSVAGFRIDTQVDRGVRNATFKDNHVADVENFAFRTACGGVASDAVPVSDVTYEANTVRSAARSGFEIEARDGTLNDITHRGNEVKTSGFGVYAAGHSPVAVEESTLVENSFMGNEVGMYVDTVASGVTLRENRIEENKEWGAFNESDTGLDAVRNYWGAPNGPERPHPGSNGGSGNGRSDTIGDGDNVSENVEVKPWLSQPP